MNIIAIGLIAATLTTMSLLPQVVETIKTRKTKDISLAMYLMFSAGCFLWVIYGFRINAAPVYLANIVSFILALTMVFLKIKDG